MGEVVPMPGVFRAELEKPTPVEHVLKSALALNLREVAYVGRAIDGTLVVGGSPVDMDAAIGLLTRGIHDLANAVQVHLPADETSE
jgi:hypothetical protein